MKSIRTVDQLLENGFINSEMRVAIEKVVKKFSMALTPQLIELINSSPAQDKEALLLQFLPSEQELKISEKELADPIGDTVYTAVKGVVHRYPDRCLLMPISACAVYCRFCFRRETVGSKTRILSKEELNDAYIYIAKHTDIWEVILTGGDPFFLKPKKIMEILQALEEIKHVDIIRIHTRVPIVDSKRITEEMVGALKTSSKAIYIMIHVNHPSEFTDVVKGACARFVDAGIPVLGQTVLLKGVNDTPEVMGALMRVLVKNRIKPYYLHHGDLAQGTAHFRTTIQEGQQLMKSLRGRYSGLCQPTYVLEIPGGAGKVPIHPTYIKHNEATVENYVVEDYLGGMHDYHP
jgi:lysine 2,3-aminomutase